MKIIATMHNADWAAIISRVAGVVVLVVAVLRTQVPQVKLRHDPNLPSNLCQECCVIGVSSDAARGPLFIENRTDSVIYGGGSFWARRCYTEQRDKKRKSSSHDGADDIS